ncbi:carboxylesterase [Pandoraea sp. SD6-2]|uniref:alpha/beta hydrolase n=1 Tax=Pandoraea sp. SD6-2 TaxID=1286093 RepID=UPI001FEFD1AD|nr:alpha/beta fold hydrolase [Pandoraea sp. SD6-2]
MPKAAVLLIHGLGGTQYDLGSLRRNLADAGFRTHAIILPGHGSHASDLRAVRAEDWLRVVRIKYRQLKQRHRTVHILGLCMGALLAIEVAKLEHHVDGALVALAAPVFIDGWATPWYRAMRHVLYRIPGVAARMRVEEGGPFGIKNEHLRTIVRAKFARNESFHYRWVPLACIREVDRLRSMVMNGLESVACRTSIVHARQDELTSLRSAYFLELPL